MIAPLMTNAEFQADLLPEAQIHLSLRAASKTSLLADLAQRAALIAAIRADVVAAGLMDRESLGSTGVGHGIALPHARIDGLAKITCLLSILAKPIEYGSIDGGKVDVVFLLLSPAGASAQHLSTLAAATRRLRRADCLAALRQATTPAAARAAFLYESQIGSEHR